MAFSGSFMDVGGNKTPPLIVTSSGIVSVPILASGAFASGIVIESKYPCDQCDTSTQFSKLIRVRDSYYCHTCASYDPKEGFTRRAEFILRSVPCHDAPWSIIADWLEDNNRTNDANWVRNNRC